MKTVRNEKCLRTNAVFPNNKVLTCNKNTLLIKFRELELLKNRAGT